MRYREKDVKLSFRTQKAQLEDLKAKAAITGVSVAEYIRSSIDARLHSGRVRKDAENGTERKVDSTNQ